MFGNNSVRKQELDIKKQRMELIDKIFVRKVFSKLYNIDVNEWRTLGANLAPEIAAAAGIDEPAMILRIEKIIEAGVFDILGSVKIVFAKFLKEMKAEQLDDPGLD